jgi:hypothetical protein
MSLRVCKDFACCAHDLLVARHPTVGEALKVHHHVVKPLKRRWHSVVVARIAPMTDKRDELVSGPRHGHPLLKQALCGGTALAQQQPGLVHVS